ncbi:hypothetical protein [Aquimarina aquimarini]|uniref:hypothetical protein n=1 Tax=Aquimarina aquimarini TaxID=1191734 RepID=UPI001F272B61|nr:hypothetical protein [Aquimarina aquimarini]
MRNFIIIGALALMLASCGTDNKPKIIHNSRDDKGVTELKRDSTFIEIADLPMQIDSTEYLIHVIGDYKIENSRGKTLSKWSSYGSESFSISQYGGYKISGNISNVKFQHQDAIELVALTDKVVKISSILFLHEVYKNTDKQLLLYEVIDKDTNQDGKLDYNDINTLYISKINGSNFKKITDTNQELIDWKIITSNNRLYLRSIEDINKDGKFDKKDSVHYKFVDLNTDNLNVIEYKPV